MIGRYLWSALCLASVGCSDDNASCTIVASNYDQSCQVASDCVNATSGELCDGLCHAANVAINRREQTRYLADLTRATAGQPDTICNGPCEGLPSCESGTCKYRSCQLGSKR